MARKLRKFVLPSIIGVTVLSGALAIPFYLESNKTIDSNYRFTINEDDESIIPVLNEVEEKYPMRPYLEETVAKTKDYYKKEDDENTQRNSLIYYDNTYAPNTGIIYSSEEPFEIVSSMDGNIKKVSEDNLLGKYVEIEHDNGYKTIYYSLSETSVIEGAEITKGDTIGTSGFCKILNESKNNLLFETYKDGKLFDPEDFYNVNFE